MTVQTIENNYPQIKEVLKALNHAIRRDILLYLKDLNRETSFSELMDYLENDTKVSGQFSYHLKLLQQSNLLAKVNDKYSITPLGIRAISMLDLVNIEDSKDTMVDKISNSYKNLTAIDQMLLAFHAFCLISFIVPAPLLLFDYKRFSIFLLPMVIGLLLFIGLTSFSYFKLRYLPSVLILFSVIWIVFLGYNQLKIALIYVASGLDIMFLYLTFLNNINRRSVIYIDLFFTIISSIAVIVTIAWIIYADYIVNQPN